MPYLKSCHRGLAGGYPNWGYPVGCPGGLSGCGFSRGLFRVGYPDVGCPAGLSGVGYPVLSVSWLLLGGLLPAAAGLLLGYSCLLSAAAGLLGIVRAEWPRPVLSVDYPVPSS